MKKQDYNNHSRYVPGFHFVTSTLILVLLVLSIITLVKSTSNTDLLYIGLFELIMALVAGLLFFYTRQFATGLQDRTIRAEENFRHFALTGKPLDSRISLAQMVALRFANDQEFVTLANKALTDNMSPADIKKAIQHWRADHHRI